MEVAGLIIALLSLIVAVIGLPAFKRLQEIIKLGKEKIKLLKEQKRIKEVQPKFEVVLSGTNKVIRLVNTQSTAYKLSFVAIHFVGPISLIADKTQVTSQETVSLFLGNDFEPNLNSQLMISIGYQDIDGRNYQQTFHFKDQKISLPEFLK